MRSMGSLGSFAGALCAAVWATCGAVGLFSAAGAAEGWGCCAKAMDGDRKDAIKRAAAQKRGDILRNFSCGRICHYSLRSSASFAVKILTAKYAEEGKEPKEILFLTGVRLGVAAGA
jgi:hypothetical protein